MTRTMTRITLALATAAAVGCAGDGDDTAPTNDTGGAADAGADSAVADTVGSDAGATDTAGSDSGGGGGDAPTFYTFGLDGLTAVDLTDGTSWEVVPAGESPIDQAGGYAIASVSPAFLENDLRIYDVATGDLVGELPDATQGVLVQTSAGWNVWYREMDSPELGPWYSAGVDGTGAALLGVDDWEAVTLTPDRRTGVFCSQNVTSDNNFLARVGVDDPTSPTAEVELDTGIEWGCGTMMGMTADGHLVARVDNGVSDAVVSMLDTSLSVVTTFDEYVGTTPYGPGMTNDSFLVRDGDDRMVELRADGSTTPRDWLHDTYPFPSQQGAPPPTDVVSNGQGWLLVTSGVDEKTLARADGSEATSYMNAPGGGLQALFSLY